MVDVLDCEEMAGSLFVDEHGCVLRNEEVIFCQAVRRGIGGCECSPLSADYANVSSLASVVAQEIATELPGVRFEIVEEDGDAVVRFDYLGGVVEVQVSWNEASNQLPLLTVRDGFSREQFASIVTENWYLAVAYAVEALHYLAAVERRSNCLVRVFSVANWGFSAGAESCGLQDAHRHANLSPLGVAQAVNLGVCPNDV
jgi:hypothetical protein